jgi:hypothetical protein
MAERDARVTDYPTDQDEEIAVYLFNDNSPGDRTLIGAVLERGPLLGWITLIFLLMGAFVLYMWSQQRAYWHPTLLLLLFPILWMALHYLPLVVEVRITPRQLSFRRLINLCSIPWDHITRVRVYSLRTCGITYVWVRGRMAAPLAFFPLWIPWYRPEKERELDRLVEDIARRVPVKHSA